jgi:hypothetical protein
MPAKERWKSNPLKHMIILKKGPAVFAHKPGFKALFGL